MSGLKGGEGTTVQWAAAAAAALRAHDEAVVVGTRAGGGGIDWEGDVWLDAPLALRRSTLLALGAGAYTRPLFSST